MSSVEFDEITSFLAEHPPFDELTEQQLARLASSVEIAYFRAGSEILKLSEPIQDLYVIRSGAVEIFKRDGELFNRLESGDVFGQAGLLMNRRVRFPAIALEDSLVYCVPSELFHGLFDENENFADFFDLSGGSQLRQAISAKTDANDLTTVKVRDLQLREVVTIPNTASVRDAAITMTEEQISSLLVVDHSLPSNVDDEAPVVGIITDRDLRSRILASDRPPTSNVAEAMTPQLITIDENSYVFEAMLTMLRHNVHHLPIVQQNHPIGVLSLSDMLYHESQSSILFVRGIFGQNSVEELQNYAQQLPAVFLRLVNEDANSHMIGSAMAVIGRSFKQRLLELAEQQLGPPPVKYCLLALGSMGRDEQFIVTDQDNALILDDNFEEKQHGGYFKALASYLCDGLAACGYRYCSGEIMATNPEWRKTRSEWKQLFSDWIDHPNPKALLNSSIFFDLDGVAGQTRWANQLKKHIAQKSKENAKFLACLARNALLRTPPLGFFKEFVVEKDGEHNNSINLKRRGTAPLTDVIRVHALAVGTKTQNSLERLEEIKAANVLPPGKAQDLSDALEYIAMVRVRHQAADIELDREPDNNIEPENLSSFEKRNLKEAFQVLSNAQNYLKFCYTANRSLR